MPRYPKLSQNAHVLPYFFAPEVNANVEKVARLHLGDTYQPLPKPAQTVGLKQNNRYDRIGGLETLRKATAQRCREQYGYDVHWHRIYVTAGCLGALNICCSTILEPGDEVIEITPCWPNFGGVVQLRGATSVHVPISLHAWPESSPSDFAQHLKDAITDKTVAVYFCDPNNPSGFVLPEEYIDVIQKIALEYRLWIIHDIAYSDLIFGPLQQTHLISNDDIAHQTLVTGSFSKSFSMAGHRVGYIICPEKLRSEVCKVLTFIEFHPSNIAQLMALSCIEAGEDVIREAVRAYSHGANIVNETLKADFHQPEAAAYVFIKLGSRSKWTSERTAEFLTNCAKNNVTLSPGFPFGTDFANFVRLCYTAEPPDILNEACLRLNPLIAELSKE